MKILHISPTYFPAHRYGGPIQSVHNLNKELVRQGVAVTVLTTNVDGSADLDVSLGRAVMIDGVEVFYFPAKWLRRWFYAPALFRFLNEQIREFDLVHITSVFLSFSFFGARAARRHNKPYIISPRGSLMRQTFASKFWKKWLYLSLIEKRNLAGATVIHLTSEAEKMDYLAAGFPSRRTAVIGNSLNPESFAEVPVEAVLAWRKKMGLQPDKKIILCLGRLDWTKGFDDLLPAFADVLRREPQAVLVLAGSDERGYQKTIENFIRKNGLAEKVILAGPLGNSEKIVALKAVDVFVSASYSESFGVAAAEAMAAGRPVILTKGVALAALAAEMGAGLVIGKSRPELAAAIIAVLADREKASVMGQNGRQAALDNFSGIKIARNFISLYNSIINETG